MKTNKKIHKSCFYISPIGDPHSLVRKRSDKMEKFVIKEVTEKLGYKTIRADKLSQPGIITAQIIDHLLNDSLVIADLSDHSPNVYYELAIRHMIGKPYIHLIEF